MSTDIAESLPKRKFAPAAAAKPEGKKEAPKGKSGGGKGASEEGSEKRIRQAVYDIRYRARREDIDLKAAFAQYMSNSSLSQAERTAVRAKLFGKAGGVTEKFIVGADSWASDNVANALYQVFVERDKSDELKLAYLQQLDEDENKKYKVRVTDKNGRTYVRFADRAKITELRQNPNIESVEMTEHGEPYEGERKKGQMTARAKAGKKLDPVGKEDKDIDNDGDHDKTDKYLLKRRKAIGSAIRKRADKKIKEAYLADGTISTEPKNPTKITGKGVDNYATGAVKISPDDGQTDPAVKPKGVYSHFQLNGTELSESQKKLFEMMKNKEEEKKEKVSDMMTKTSVKKEDEQEEEKPDMRSKYAMINLIKNKLRAAGQRDPVVMAVDACEETVDEGAVGLKNVVKGITKATKAAGKATRKGKILGDGVDKTGKVVVSGLAGIGAGEMVADKMFKPGVKKKKIDPKKGTAKKTAVPVKDKKTKQSSLQQFKKLFVGDEEGRKTPKYNPYGKDSNMNPTKASETTGP